MPVLLSDLSVSTLSACCSPEHLFFFVIFKSNSKLSLLVGLIALRTDIRYCWTFSGRELVLIICHTIQRIIQSGHSISFNLLIILSRGLLCVFVCVYVCIYIYKID